MKILKTGKRAPLWAVVLLVVSSFFIGCTRDLGTDVPGGETNEGDASVTMTINTPQATLPTALSRAQTAEESAISAVKVLVFNAGTGNTFMYQVSGSDISPGNNNQPKFKISLRETSDPLKLLVITNASEAFSGFAPEPGTTEAEIRGMLNAVYSTNGFNSGLPMYGEVSLPGGIDASQNYNLPVTVLRAVARIDVVKELVDGAEDFILEEVYAFRANSLIQLIPDALVSGSVPKVESPSVPAGAEFLDTELSSSVPGGTESIIQLYIPEAKTVGSNSEKVTGVTTIVIGGRYGGADNPVTYYRADFDSGIAGHPFGQVLRNHRYIFKIKKVGSEGWGSPDLAANNMSASMQVEVVTWEDFSSELYLGNDRFGISERSVSLRYVKDRTDTVKVESTLTYQIQWMANGSPVGPSTSNFNETISNDNFDVKIVREASDGEYVTRLVFNTRSHNHLGDIITNTLRVTAGKWNIDLTVKQDNSHMYSNRYLSVLTVEGVGNLGVNMLAPDASGLAMRKVLDNQFSPSGMIRIGGPSYTRILNNDNWTNTSADDNLFILKRLFGSQDIVYFPYGVNVSVRMAQLLVDWLEEDTHRVLIIGTDSDATNKNLRTAAKFAADGTWAFSNIATVSTNFLRAQESAGTEDFFNGPFGAVAENASFNRADVTAGYSSNYSTAVTPLITGDRTGYTNYMFFGVNKKNRVIYHGDANLFQSGQMSNNNGTVGSDLDRLMANTWAWAVEQVIYGAD